LAAQEILAKFGGEIPSCPEKLFSIRGLGPYTVGAILSFAFEQRAPAIDGNVSRVIARYFCIEENICKTSTKRTIHHLAENLLDPHKPWVSAEALIELGALICTAKPRCEECPLQEKCVAHKQKKAEILPIKNTEKSLTSLQRAVVVIESQGKVLLKKGEEGKVMADLYEFPYFEMKEKRWPLQKITRAVEREFGFEVKRVGMLAKVEHTFTRYRATLYPVRFLGTRTHDEIKPYSWVSIDVLRGLPFSSGHKKILQAAFCS
jgi:A/G-specific adenine glycosylase